MSRVYTVQFGTGSPSVGVLVSAAQDLIQIKGASGKMLRILSRWVGADDTTLPTAQMIQLRDRVLPATVTDGSGGATPTIFKTDFGDSAASFTVLANNTTKATSTGVAIQV